MAEIAEFFSVLDENGEEIKCRTLLMFTSPQNEKDIVIYTDDTVNEDGLENIYASYYCYEGEVLRLLDIDNEADWVLIQEVLAEITENDEEEA